MSVVEVGRVLGIGESDALEVTDCSCDVDAAVGSDVIEIDSVVESAVPAAEETELIEPKFELVMLYSTVDDTGLDGIEVGDPELEVPVLMNVALVLSSDPGDVDSDDVPEMDITGVVVKVTPIVIVSDKAELGVKLEVK